MRYLKFASLAALVLSSCARNPYRSLQPSSIAASESQKLLSKPAVTRELYRCTVDGRFFIKRFHLSGILLFKSFDDGSLRAVFQNELGLSFFNFKWDARDSFSVSSIMPQLNRPAIIRTLRTDFELLLRKNLDTAGKRYLQLGNAHVVEVRKNSGYAWYRFAAPQIAYGGRALVTSIATDSLAAEASLPGRILIEHHKAHFTIELNRIHPDDN